MNLKSLVPPKTNWKTTVLTDFLVNYETKMHKLFGTESNQVFKWNLNSKRSLRVNHKECAKNQNSQKVSIYENFCSIQQVIDETMPSSSTHEIKDCIEKLNLRNAPCLNYLIDYIENADHIYIKNVFFHTR